MKLLYIDLFCGAGGTSTGVESARIDGRQCAKVIACVNHDANAIASHAANHPDTLHFTEDIRTLGLSPLKNHAQKYQKLYPDAHLVLWASLECTNFSKAKGGQARDADSRTLAEHLFRYIEVLSPDYIQIENVEEFMSWGDMDENGKPISMDKGRLYGSWKNNVKKYGYNFDHRILNAADFGAYTSRKRFFGIFAKKGLPIVFPEATHAKQAQRTLFSSLEKWKPVKDVLDFADEGISIFGRSNPLSEKTLERIHAGLVKFVAGGKDAFLSRYNTVRPQDTCKSIDEPCGVLTTENRFAKVQCHFLSKYFSGHPESKNISIDEPAHTIKCKDNHALVTSDFLAAYYGTGYNVHSVNVPSPTVTTKDRLSLASPFFINYYTGGGQLSEIGKPCPAVTTVPKQRLVFIDQQFGNSKPIGTDQPCGAITTNPKYSLVNCRPWIMNTNFNNVGGSIEEPSQVITANRKWHYLMNPQFRSPGASVENPCFTLIARMDKMPPYLVATETGGVAIEVYETDSPVTVKIKEFMALYEIVDIKMRMLKIPELKKIMGFPENYTLIGTQADQKKFIGNAVEVNMAKVLCESLAYKFIKVSTGSLEAIIPEKSDKICNIILSNCSCKIILDNTNMNNSENKNDRRIIDGKIGITIPLREINTKKYLQKINDKICPIQYRNNQIWFLTKYSFIYLFVIEGKYYEFDIRDVKELNLPDPMKDYEVIIRNQRKWLLSFIEKVEANNYFIDFGSSMKLL